VIWSIFAHAKLGQAERANQMFNMINPINHALTEADVATYKVEPYVIAADVYSVAPHTGRGGWTRYTGSAGWMYRAGLEAILGVTREADILRVKPCINADWQGFKFHLWFGETDYRIEVKRGDGPKHSKHDDVEINSTQEFAILLKNSGGTRSIALTIPE
jgi:cyclic beta-1,2-glucan synthetase